MSNLQIEIMLNIDGKSISNESMISTPFNHLTINQSIRPFHVFACGQGNASLTES